MTGKGTRSHRSSWRGRTLCGTLALPHQGHHTESLSVFAAVHWTATAYFIARAGAGIRFSSPLAGRRDDCVGLAVASEDLGDLAAGLQVLDKIAKVSCCQRSPGWDAHCLVDFHVGLGKQP
jgi:hypothetical protein